MIDLRTDRENRKLLGSAGVLRAGSCFETTARHKRSLGAAVRLHLPGPKAAPNHRGTKFAKALEIATSDVDRQKALEDFEGDFFSKTSRALTALCKSKLLVL